jgi:hypothetical protein
VRGGCGRSQAAGRRPRPAQVPALGEHSLGLLDNDPTIQRGLQLLGEHLTTADGTFGRDPDRRDIAQRLTQRQIGLGRYCLMGHPRPISTS